MAYESKYGLTQSHSNFIYRMSIQHKRNVLSLLRQRSGRYDKYSSINVRDLNMGELFEAIAAYSYNALQGAHHDATGITVREGYGVWTGKGRTPGAKNKPKPVSSEGYDYDAPIKSFDALAEEIEARKAPVPALEAPKRDNVEAANNAPSSEEIDAKIEALANAFEKAIDNELKDYVRQETFNFNKIETNNAINELRSNFTDEINKIKNEIILSKPTIVHVSKQEGEKRVIKDLGLQHRQFPLLLETCQVKLPDGHHHNIWLHGPMGTGKTTAAHNVAKALGLNFYTNGKLTSEFQLLGFINTSGYQSTQFREAYEKGGIYLADEIDGWLPDALIALNGALANSHCAFGDNKLVERHPDFIFIGAANTTGSGATIEYVARFQQDAAFTDRFVFIDWPIDDALEDAMCDNKGWLAMVRETRTKIATKQIKNHHVSPRATIYGAYLLKSGMSAETVMRMVLKKGLSDAQWDMIKPTVVV